MKLWKRNLILIIVVIVILALPPLVMNAEFSGSDDQAEQQITKIAPDYKPWFSSVLEPKSGEIESLLFALQAALGAGIVGFVLGRLTANKTRAGAENDTN